MLQEFSVRLPVLLKFIVFGAFIATVIIFGRAFCGKVCPIGLLQDLIYKIPFPLKIRRFKSDKYLRYIKYVVLLIALISLGFNSPETTQLPVIAVVIVLASAAFSFIVISRPFCKYLCHFGVVFGAGNKTTLRKYTLDPRKCTKCGACVKSCKMDIVPYNPPNSLECIHCGMCVKVCPHKALTIKQ